MVPPVLSIIAPHSGAALPRKNGDGAGEFGMVFAETLKAGAASVPDQNSDEQVNSYSLEKADTPDNLPDVLSSDFDQPAIPGAALVCDRGARVVLPARLSASPHIAAMPGSAEIEQDTRDPDADAPVSPTGKIGPIPVTKADTLGHPRPLTGAVSVADMQPAAGLADRCVSSQIVRDIAKPSLLTDTPSLPLSAAGQQSDHAMTAGDMLARNNRDADLATAWHGDKHAVSSVVKGSEVLSQTKDMRTDVAQRAERGQHPSGSALTMTITPLQATFFAQASSGLAVADLALMMSEPHRLGGQATDDSQVGLPLVPDKPVFSATVTGAAALTDSPRQIAQQMAVAVASHDGNTVEIALNPVELGRVRLQITAQDGAIVLHVLAERPDTADLLRRHIDALAQEFRTLGFQDLTFSFGGESTAQPRNDRPTENADLAMDTETDGHAPVTGPLHATGALDIRL